MRSFFSGLFAGILLFLLISVIQIDILPNLEEFIASRYVNVVGPFFIAIEGALIVAFIIRWIVISIYDLEYDKVAPFFGVSLISIPSKLFNKLSNRGVK